MAATQKKTTGSSKKRASTTAPKPKKKSTTQKNVKKKLSSPKKTTKAAQPQPRIIKAERQPVIISKSTPVIENTEPRTLTHGVKSVDGMIGVNEFRQHQATPRLKIGPNTIKSKNHADVEPTVVERVTPEDTAKDDATSNPEPSTQQDFTIPTDHQIPEDFGPTDAVEQTQQQSLGSDPFADLVHDIEEHSQVKTETPSSIQPDPVVSTSSSSITEEMDVHKLYDSKHYHVPIRSQFLKTTGAYMFEFTIIVLLITIFIIILIDAEIYNPGFELPFDML